MSRPAVAFQLLLALPLLLAPGCAGEEEPEGPPRQGQRGPFVRFTLVNGTGQEVVAASLSPAAVPGYVEELLDEPLPAGEGASVEVEAGVWSLSYRLEDGSEGAEPALTLESDRVFRLEAP